MQFLLKLKDRECTLHIFLKRDNDPSLTEIHFMTWERVSYAYSQMIKNEDRWVYSGTSQKKGFIV